MSTIAAEATVGKALVVPASIEAVVAITTVVRQRRTVTEVKIASLCPQ